MRYRFPDTSCHYAQKEARVIRPAERITLSSGYIHGYDKAFRPPSTFGAYSIFNRIMSPFINCLPVIHQKDCIKCGLCAAQCPVDACTWEKGEYPVIHKKKCIKCYCCQEFCPGDAITLNGRMFKLTNYLAGTSRDI